MSASTITINNREIPIPLSWNGLTVKQALTCYQVLMSDTLGIFSPQELLPYKRIELMKCVLGIDDQFLRRWHADCIQAYGDEEGPLIYFSELEEVSRVATTFLFEELEEGRVQVSLTYTRCPWPWMEHGPGKNGKPRRLYGPANELDNLTIYELGMTFMALERFLETQDDDYALELLAILYRPKKPHTRENAMSAYQGDRRLPLLHHEATIPARKKLMAKLPDLVRAFLVFWFACCRQRIIRQFPNIFHQPEPNAAGERVGNDYAWGGILLNLADGIIHLDAVATQPWSNALTYLSMLEDRRKEMEMELAKQKQKIR